MGKFWCGKSGLLGLSMLLRLTAEPKAPRTNPFTKLRTFADPLRIRLLVEPLKAELFERNLLR